ncbi:hypothetical protein HS088_TW06G00620 [Tripterygium wilfordii]|uniref:Helicase C-terminal domain-containing protein n=1 Tax=Tripterygium wilfordii TaxID=458696 RepID=A0A7J7DJH5_TRIWF|nr:hypothetical protein HS088_TW06G00620 [Tripterygium wilfordii]
MVQSIKEVFKGSSIFSYFLVGYVLSRKLYGILMRPVPMNLLLQDDVGCRKTLVGFLACMEVIGSGYQAAFMVPTELLTVQHYEHLLSLLEKMEDQSKPTIALLTGSKQSQMIRRACFHFCLIPEEVEFFALCIAMVDEQHRFGVIRQGKDTTKIERKPTWRNSKNFGNLFSITFDVIRPLKACHAEQMMLNELENCGKVYLMYPVIEQSAELPQLRAASADLEVISERFEDYNCGLLHGKLKSDEKDEALRRFRYGETRMLFSTQVIEIVVDVPDASMMVVLK